MNVEIPPDESAPPNLIPMNATIGADLELMAVKNKKSLACMGRHKSVWVDQSERTVTCRECGWVIDPFDYIWDWASRGDQRMQGLKEIEVKRKIQQAQHDDLERRIKNLRSRLKNAGHPQSDANRHEYMIALWNPHIADKHLEKAKAEGDALAYPTPPKRARDCRKDF